IGIRLQFINVGSLTKNNRSTDFDCLRIKKCFVAVLQLCQLLCYIEICLHNSTKCPKLAIFVMDGCQVATAQLVGQVEGVFKVIFGASAASQVNGIADNQLVHFVFEEKVKP